MKPLPADYIPVYANQIHHEGKLVLSEANALEIMRGYRHYLTYRRTLQQIAQNGTSNADLALQARNALREEVPLPAPSRPRLVSVDAIRTTSADEQRLTALHRAAVDFTP